MVITVNMRLPAVAAVRTIDEWIERRNHSTCCRQLPAVMSVCDNVSLLSGVVRKDRLGLKMSTERVFPDRVVHSTCEHALAILFRHDCCYAPTVYFLLCSKFAAAWLDSAPPLWPLCESKLTLLFSREGYVLVFDHFEVSHRCCVFV